MPLIDASFPTPSSGATVLLSGAEDQDCKDLDAVLYEIEPWRKEHHGWRDGCVQFELREL